MKIGNRLNTGSRLNKITKVTMPHSTFKCNELIRLYLVEKRVFSVVRQLSRNVKHWHSGKMVERWAALGLIEAEKRFRRIKGYRSIPVLEAALQRKTALDKSVVA